jgi:proline racemase
MREIPCIDSHTEGEPTRMVREQALPLPGGDIAARLVEFNRQFDTNFLPLLLEPRAFEAVVGAWIGSPTAPNCLHDIIFFNPTGALGMCGHGTIGVLATLAFESLPPGEYQLNSPVGIVKTKLLDNHRVQLQNVVSHRIAKGVSVDVGPFGRVTGDVAWGGNTFFLVENSPIAVEIENLKELEDFAKAAMVAVRQAGFPDVNHVEVFGPTTLPGAYAKNYVLCPGGEYDRSPCGTGTSAKLACLAADGKLAPETPVTIESIIGTSYRGWYSPHPDGIIPTIEGTAYVTAKSTLLFDVDDPMRVGIRK